MLIEKAKNRVEYSPNDRSTVIMAHGSFTSPGPSKTTAHLLMVLQSIIVAICTITIVSFLLPGPAAARDIIDRKSTRFADYPQGAIVIDTSERRLYYMLEDGKALRYRVAVGKPHMQWFGRTFVTLKRKNPGWRPTPRMRRLGYPAYVPPGPKNPLGVRAIYLGWSEYRIHGTTSPRSIGRAASSGCIRMLNKDVVDLFKRVHIGAPVDVIK